MFLQQPFFLTLITVFFHFASRAKNSGVLTQSLNMSVTINDE